VGWFKSDVKVTTYVATMESAVIRWR